MKEALHRQIAIASDTQDADAMAERAQLQTALDRLKAEDAGDAPAKKKKGKNNKDARTPTE